MKTVVYNQKGEEINKINLSDEVFGIKANTDLLHQVVVSQMSNRRQGTAHTKNRGEVRGGGKKPWRQKGTGRARHGSRRSPIWKGGGITFGPRSDRNYKKTIPQKMRRNALLMSLSAKARDGELIIVDDFNIKNHKTKNIKILLDKLPFPDKSCLIVLPTPNKDIILGARNIAGTETMQVKNLTALDVLSFKRLILDQGTLSMIEKSFLKKLKLKI